jgi:hypothetical protein
VVTRSFAKLGREKRAARTMNLILRCLARERRASDGGRVSLKIDAMFHLPPIFSKQSLEGPGP